MFLSWSRDQRAKKTNWRSNILFSAPLLYHCLFLAATDMHTCSTDDLLLYLYGDLSAEERLLTEVVLREQWGLREKLRVVQEAADQLDATTLEAPSALSVQRILDHLYDHSNSSILSESAADLH